MDWSGDEKEEYPSENDEKYENDLFDNVPEPHLQDQTWQNEAARSDFIAITSVLAELDQDPDRDYDFTTESNHPSTPTSPSSSTQEDRDLNIMGTAVSDNGINPYNAETGVDLDLYPDEAWMQRLRMIEIGFTMWTFSQIPFFCVSPILFWLLWWLTCIMFVYQPQ